MASKLRTYKSQELQCSQTLLLHRVLAPGWRASAQPSDSTLWMAALRYWLKSSNYIISTCHIPALGLSLNPSIWSLTTYISQEIGSLTLVTAFICCFDHLPVISRNSANTFWLKVQSSWRRSESWSVSIGRLQQSKSLDSQCQMDHPLLCNADSKVWLYMSQKL